MIRRVLHGAGAVIVSQILQAASGLFLLPLYLKEWSVSAYGEWMVLYSLVAYLNTLDFGITAAATNAATIAYARRDWAEFKRVQGTALAAALAIATAGCLLVGGGVVLLPVERWLNVRQFSAFTTRSVVFLLAFSLLGAIPCRQLTSTFAAIGEFATYQWLSNSLLLANTLTTVVILVGGGGPALLAFAYAGLTIIFAIVALGLLIRRDRRIIPDTRDFDRHTAGSLATPSAWFTVNIFASALALQGPILLISRTLGGEAVAVLTTVRTLSNLTRQVSGLLRFPLRPEFAALAATGDRTSISRVFRLSSAADGIVNACLLAGLWSGGSWLISEWSHHRLRADTPFLRMMLIAIALEGLMGGLTKVSVAINHLGPWVSSQLVGTVGALALASLLIPRYGILAVPLGNIPATFFIMGPVAMSSACRDARLSLGFLSWRVVLPFLISAALALGISQVASINAPAVPPLSGAISGLLAFAAATVTSFMFALTAEERLGLRQRWASADYDK